jgi:hypothetical protein
MARRETISSLPTSAEQQRHGVHERTLLCGRTWACMAKELGRRFPGEGCGKDLDLWTTSFYDRKAERVIMLFSVISANANAQC